MARAKKGSLILETARQRLAGLKSIAPTPDFGGDLTVTGYEEEINSLSNLLETYNRDVSALDDKQIALHTAENGLRDKNRRMLSAAEAKFGRDSSQYEQAGGTRLSERKRPGPRPRPGDSTKKTTSPTP